MTNTQIENVSRSDTGIEYSTPSKPNHRGSSSAKPTPNSTSRTMEMAVDVKALPRPETADR